MNTETGQLKKFVNDKELQKALNDLDPLVQVDEKDMTAKQKREMQVSKFDNKSKLGKLFTNHRKQKRKGTRSKAYHRRKR